MAKKLLTAAVLLALSVPSALHAAGGELKTEKEKTLYAIGLVLSRNIASFNLTEAELETVKAGLMDGALGRPKKVELETMGPKLGEFAQQRMAAAAEVEKKASVGFLEKAAKEKGAVKKPSGLVYVEEKPGTGPSPKATDKVKVHYQGTLTDGTVFDSSIKRKEPATFPVNGVIPCWVEALQLMKVGGKAKLVCPSSIAYGDKGQPPVIKPGATLVFHVELLEIVK